jgi:hypothetical protein
MERREWRKTLFVSSQTGLQVFTSPMIMHLEAVAQRGGDFAVTCKFIGEREQTWAPFTRLEAESLVRHILVLLEHVR